MSSDKLVATKEQYPYIEAFVDSVHNILRTMGYLEVEYVNSWKFSSAMLHDRFGAVMQVDSGYIGVLMSKESATLVVASFMGRDLDSMSEAEVSGGIVELLNMIAGSAKTRLAETEFAYQLFMPVACDMEKLLGFADSEHSIILQFELDGHHLMLNVALGKK